MRRLAIEAGSQETEVAECKEGEDDCEKPAPTPAETEDAGLDDTELITIIVSTVLGIILALTTGVVVYQLCKHRKNVA